MLAATEAVFGAIDVLDSRYTGYKFTFNDVTADNASSAGFVLGGTPIDPYGIDLRLVGCLLEKNGELISTAAGAFAGERKKRAVLDAFQRVALTSAPFTPSAGWSV